MSLVTFNEEDTVFTVCSSCGREFQRFGSELLKAPLISQVRKMILGLVRMMILDDLKDPSDVYSVLQRSGRLKFSD